jgi:CBS domain-containing protein
MKVSEVLKRKNDAGAVATTSPDAVVAKVASTLVERRIGSLVVCDETKHVLGILTERDIVRGVSRHGGQALGMRASELMSRALVCTPELEVSQVMRTMTNERARHLVVMVGDRLAGIVSIGDVVQSRLDQCELEVRVLRDYSRARSVPLRKLG